MGTGSLGRAGWKGKEGKLPFVWEQQDILELCVGLDDEPAGSLCVTITRQTNTGYMVVGVCYRLPDQEEVDKAFFR